MLFREDTDTNTHNATYCDTRLQMCRDTPHCNDDASL